MSQHFISIFSFRIFVFCLLLSTNSVAQTTEMELVGIGIYNEFNKANMIMKIETSSDETASVTERFSILILEPKPERRWGQFWSQNLSLNNGIETLTSNFDDIQLMSSVIKGSLEAGDLVTFEIQNDNQMYMSLNSIELTGFDNVGFYSFLLSAFTGRVPPSTTLKNQLTGDNRESFESDSLFFDSLGYGPERVAVVESWVDPAEPEPAVVEEIQAAEEVQNVPVPVGISETELAEQERQRLEEEAEQARIAAEEQALAEQQRLAEETAAEAERERALAELVASQNQLRLIRNKVTRNMEYPRSAVRFNREGTVRVALTLNRDGSIYDVLIIEESEHGSLNNAAIAGVEDSEPFDPIPEIITTEQTTFEFPISFYLQN